MKARALCCIVCCLLPRLVRAQEVSGNIQGRVASPRLDPVPDVRVVVASPSLQGTRSTQTDTHGFFQVIDVPSGMLTILLYVLGFHQVVLSRYVVHTVS